MNLLAGLDFTEEEVIAEIERIIDRHMYMTQIEPGVYEDDIYVDPYDELPSDMVREIVDATDPRDALFSVMDEPVTQCIMGAEDAFMDTMRLYWDTEKFGEFIDYEEFVRDWMFDHVYFNFPYDHYLKQEVLVNLVVDTGDGDYDFTLNNFLSYNAHEEEYKEIEEESGILWLVEQQGYTEDDLIHAIENGTENRFLKSIIRELHNVTSHMNALTFFVSMTLDDFIKIMEVKNKDEHDNVSITIDPSTSCGLIDFWNGAGGLMEIELDKAVQIPLKFIDPHVDGTIGYGVQDIYGIHRDFWAKGAVDMETVERMLGGE